MKLLKVIMTEFVGTNKTETYRELALTKIFAHSTLKKDFGHLKNRHWDWEPNGKFWQWLVETPVSEIQANKEKYQPHMLKKAALHEAAHAVIGQLTFIPIDSVTIVPDPYEKNLGIVAAHPFIAPITNESDNMGFWAWRVIVQRLAGATIELLKNRQISNGCKTDFSTTVKIVQNTIPVSSQVSWIEFCIESVLMLVKQPAVYKAIEEVACRLYATGYIDTRELERIVDHWVLKCSNPPGFTKLILNSVEIERLFAPDPGAISLEERYQVIDQMQKMNGSFVQEMTRLLPKQYDENSNALITVIFTEEFWLP